MKDLVTGELDGMFECYYSDGDEFPEGKKLLRTDTLPKLSPFVSIIDMSMNNMAFNQRLFQCNLALF